MTKQTYLHDKHVALGAKMVDFAGWRMPVQYTTIIEEHNTVRNSVGIFDVSHMGEVFVTGLESLDFLQKMVPQDISALEYEKAVYCQLPNPKGGLIDDLIIYKLGINSYLIICNASRVEEDVNWLSLNVGDMDVVIDNQSHNYSLLAVQGPKADELLRSMGMTTRQVSFTIKPSKILDFNLFLSRTGYTGEDGYELLVENKYAPDLWDALLDYGQSYGIKPIGLGARDTLRLEAALPLYGNDLDEDTSPVEAGLAWSIPREKDVDYIGKETIMRHLVQKPSRKLIGLRMIDKNIARHGYDVYYKGERVGVVTSGGISPTNNCNIAMAYVNNTDEVSVGNTIQIMIREKLHDAVVVKIPFITKKNKVKNL